MLPRLNAWVAFARTPNGRTTTRRKNTLIANAASAKIATKIPVTSNALRLPLENTAVAGT